MNAVDKPLALITGATSGIGLELVSRLSCPRQSATTARSTPAWNRCIAVLWRSTCGDTFFAARLGQDATALATARRSRWSTPSRDSARPRALGNATSPSWSPCSRNHARSTRAVSAQSGTTRSLRPLPCSSR